MKHRISSSFFAVLCALAGAAHGAAPANEGVYIGIDAGVNSASTLTDNRNRPTFGALLGYRYNEHLALEGFARSLDSFGDGVDAPQSHYGIGVVGSVPISDSLSAFGRLGIGRTPMRDDPNTHVSKTNTDVNLALGVRYALGQSWGLRLEYAHLQKSNLNSATLGVDLRF